MHDTRYQQCKKTDMGELEHIYFDSKESFRSWLEENHDKSPGFWMIFNKKHINIECINYTEAMEEALCFGWIDSLIKKIDNEQFVRKFTPRTNKAKWSELNKKMVTALIEKGRMTDEGLRKIDVYVKTGKVDWKNKGLKNEKDSKEFDVPDFIL